MVRPFDFRFFDVDTMTDTFDDVDFFEGAVTVTRTLRLFFQYRSTVLRVFPFTLITALPPFGPARNQSVTVRPLTV